MIETTGGAAFNAARIFAGLGGQATLSTILGRDSNATKVETAILERGLETDIQRGDRTATYTAFLEANGETNTALADMDIYDDYSASISKKNDRFDWCFIDANLPPKEIGNLSQIPDTKICLTTVSPPKAKRLDQALMKADLLITNQQEAFELCGQSTMDGFFEFCINAGPAQGIVTNGAQDLALWERGVISAVKVAKDVKIKDVTGAGDAFAAAAVFALSQSASLVEAAQFATKIAQYVTAISGPWDNELVQKFA